RLYQSKFARSYTAATEVNVVHDQHKNPKTDIQVAQEAHMLPIAQVGHRRLGINLSDLLLYGHFKSKVSLDYLNTLQPRPNAKLILITSITPTAAGEGKTTTTVGLGDALNRIGKTAIVCLREPCPRPGSAVTDGASAGGRA